MTAFPTEASALETVQQALAEARPDPWQPGPGPLRVGGVFVCFPRGGTGAGGAGDRGWAGAAVALDGALSSSLVHRGQAGAPYAPGLLALREGPLLQAAALALAPRPEVLLVNATGRDHPRRAGLALHLGAVLDLPTVGVTNRPLLAQGPWPEAQPGARAPLRLGGETVACWLRIGARTRPLVVHPGWRTDLETALAVVLRAVGPARTPVALRAARHRAREARALDQGWAEGPAGPLPP